MNPQQNINATANANPNTYPNANANANVNANSNAEQMKPSRMYYKPQGPVHSMKPNDETYYDAFSHDDDFMDIPSSSDLYQRKNEFEVVTGSYEYDPNIVPNQEYVIYEPVDPNLSYSQNGQNPHGQYERVCDESYPSYAQTCCMHGNSVNCKHFFGDLKPERYPFPMPAYYQNNGACRNSQCHHHCHHNPGYQFKEYQVQNKAELIKDIQSQPDICHKEMHQKDFILPKKQASVASVFGQESGKQSSGFANEINKNSNANVNNLESESMDSYNTPQKPFISDKWHHHYPKEKVHFEDKSTNTDLDILLINQLLALKALQEENVLHMEKISLIKQSVEECKLGQLEDEEKSESLKPKKTEEVENPNKIRTLDPKMFMKLEEDKDKSDSLTKQKTANQEKPNKIQSSDPKMFMKLEEESEKVRRITIGDANHAHEVEKTSQSKPIQKVDTVTFDQRHTTANMKQIHINYPIRKMKSVDFQKHKDSNNQPDEMQKMIHIVGKEPTPVSDGENDLEVIEKNYKNEVKLETNISSIFDDKKEVPLEPYPTGDIRFVQCPHCLRKFSKASAERHIRICKSFKLFRNKLAGECHKNPHYIR